MRCFLLTLLVSLVTASLLADDPAPASSAPVAPGAVQAKPAAERDELGMMPTEHALQLFRRRVERRPDDYGSWLILGRLYLRHAREADDFQAFVEAEAALLRAKELQPGRSEILIGLAEAYSAQHRFAEAAALARKVVDADPTNDAALAVYGDAALELGDDALAEALYGRLLKLGRSPAVLVRIARLEQVRGHMDDAISNAAAALKKAQDSAAPAQQIAWYAWRLGDLHMAIGNLQGATEHFELALASARTHAPSLAGLAAARTAQGDLKAGAALYEESLQIVRVPSVMQALIDVYVALDDGASANAWAKRALALIEEEAGDPRSATAHAREAAIFYCDYSDEPAKALELAEGELKSRQTAHAWDALAWALYRNGRHDEAAAAARRALEKAPQDALLWFHAGMISVAQNDPAPAREQLQKALSINPHFSFRFSREAQATLSTLQASPSSVGH